MTTQIAFYDDVPRYTAMTVQLAEECLVGSPQGKGLLPVGTKRVLLYRDPRETGSSTTSSRPAAPWWWGRRTAPGSRYYESTTDLSGVRDLPSLLDALAHRYLDGIHCACFNPNEERFDDVVRLARETGAQGVVDAT